MENKEIDIAGNDGFVMPKAEFIVFDTDDVITTSGGGFWGDWDVDLPPIDL